jgi:ABC-type nitrate/sulfonate/bicarbonate transport system permease component/ABC-type nitrate/sulfonate/bicarbonate transport system ATPase subunit
VTALAGLSLTVRPREVVAVVGPSGCGKSTLLELVAGLQAPDEGELRVAPGACSYMPQRDLLLPWRDALGNAALALECEGMARAEARDRAEPLFERFGLAEFERTRPAGLSGGMRQRVAFLRTLLPGRPVLLLDEPFASLDSITRASMQQWLADALIQEPRTVLLVTHDVEEAVFLADRVAVLSARPGRGDRDRRAAAAPALAGGGRDRPRGCPPQGAGAGGPAVRRVALVTLLLAAVVAVWQGVASLDSVDDLTLASPAEVVEAFGDDGDLLFDEALVTGYEVLLGLAIAVAAGLLFALAMHLSRALRDAAYPLLVASQAIPIVVLAPIFVLAFDYGIGPKLAIVALICFFPITVNVLDGLHSVDAELLKLMRSFGASRLQTLRKVELPASLPFFFSGLRVAATVSVIGAVFGEWAGADRGLGRLVLLGNNQLQTPRVYAGIVILTLMAVGLFALVTLAERLVTPWNRKERPA